MYLDIDANDNLSEAAMASFKDTGPGSRITAVRLSRDGVWQWCAITGWADGPVPAYITPIEESGDGPARLLHGGAQGLRLAAIAGPAEALSAPAAVSAAVRWDVQDARQWGEPFLILRPDAEVVTVEQGDGAAPSAPRVAL
jgi:hypothetical protein